MEKQVVQFQFGGQDVTLETGAIARQATGAVLISMGETQILATVVGAKNVKPGQNFFPLSVHYQEKTYAAGKIPGGYFKREGRPTEKETLTSRLIDRPIRPLFPNGFMNEVQVVLTVMSASKTHDSDIAAMLGASAALAISGIPFNGPLGAARVGFSEDGQYMLNPSFDELSDSRLDMVVAGTKDAVLMVESEADELTEEQMLGAVMFAHKEFQVAIDAIGDFGKKFGKDAWEWEAPSIDEALLSQIKEQYQPRIVEAYQISEKMVRYNALGEIRSDAIAALGGAEGENAEAVGELFSKVEKNVVRSRVIQGLPRIDGRDQKTVRPINCEVGMLKRAHGSAVFTRGETQAIVVTTLGALRDAQIVDGLMGDEKDTFMLHYNFPPYCVGEAGMMSGPKRREIGHGRLARRGVYAMLPDEETFPYTIRVVSEITESNGSSSMASVCGASLALMDAGVPLRAPVAGIAMGLVKEDEGYAVLTDILGDEDHLGDMDFKVAGSSDGVTALQMDIKIQGITEEIMRVALAQAQEARLHILGEMNKVIDSARDEVADTAPRTYSFRIDPDKIREVIGKGGATIRSICETSGATVDLDDDGLVRVYAETKEKAQKAISMIEAITAEAEIGGVYKGKVERIVDFGAFVNILPGKDGLVHISQISEERVENVEDYMKVGDVVKVKVLDVDARGRIKLTMKDI
ncbi:MAG: polyribonucleotide nucleotidyltransferase [Gammaproteobacteria bacterium]|jgi:polyribonucleotide nucleotidyltransferase|nr:polyribonucleotide nucleotidyltransferase [Gammaproteobacteria bacterium]NCW08615.1 polyribonucleotide nucleotidyltransferase [Gammaproteobacteria bacterium]NCW73209.1 polyribonucleotide nucleotidyltransferase [Gammaproteobacteria bacterium]